LVLIGVSEKSRVLYTLRMLVALAERSSRSVA
jgi:hypothetical protein